MAFGGADSATWGLQQPVHSRPMPLQIQHPPGGDPYPIGRRMFLFDLDTIVGRAALMPCQQWADRCLGPGQYAEHHAARASVSVAGVVVAARRCVLCTYVWPWAVERRALGQRPGGGCYLADSDPACACMLVGRKACNPAYQAWAASTAILTPTRRVRADTAACPVVHPLSASNQGHQGHAA